MADDEADRAAILRRRAVFVASALASTLVACGDGADAVKSGASGVSASEQTTTPQPCLTAAPLEPDPPPDAGVAADASASATPSASAPASASASPKPKPPQPPPTACLNMLVEPEGE